MQVVNNYLEMMKFRISMLVMLTGYLGFYLGLRSQGLLSIDYYDKLVYLLIGMFLSSSGCAVLNQYLEKDFDAQMKRTKIDLYPQREFYHLMRYCLDQFYVYLEYFCLSNNK